jgi:serine/threonine protein phosphatase 1
MTLFPRISRRRAREPRVPDGQRVYSIGDIHGRLDLYLQMLKMIFEDHQARSAMSAHIVILGDMIDRGPQSRELVRQLMSPPSWADVTALLGNHESALLSALDGEQGMLELWLEHGGEATLASWGVSESAIRSRSDVDLLQSMRLALRPEELAWLRDLPESVAFGDYFFVHAGVRPGVPLNKQMTVDKLWIRRAFLQSDQPHEAMIVHGHSITDDVDEKAYRIGIDTGAYRTGRLTALGLEGGRRWILQTSPLDAI